MTETPHTGQHLQGCVSCYRFHRHATLLHRALHNPEGLTTREFTAGMPKADALQFWVDAKALGFRVVGVRDDGTDLGVKLWALPSTIERITPVSAQESGSGGVVPTEPGADSTVKPTFTARRRSKRPRRDVETMDYLGAARRFIRAAGRRVGECDEHELAELVGLRQALDEAEAVAVAGQRAYGKSWAAIGRALGITREAAFQRYGKVK